MKKNYLVTSIVFVLFFSIFSVSSLAWWNSSYDYKRALQNASTDLILPFIDEDPDGDASLSTYYGQGNGDIYYNSSDSLFTFANDTDQRCGFATVVDGGKNQINKCPSSPSGLVSYWPLDNDNGWDMISANNGALNGGITTGATGQVKNAYDFDGSNDYVDVTGMAHKDYMTITMWVKIDSADVNDGTPSHVVRWQENNFFWIRETSGNWEFRMIDGGGFTAPAHGDKWVFLAYKYNNSVGEGFVNATSVGSESLSHSSGDGSGDLIGAFDDASPTNFFNGPIDDLRFYDRALSGTEIEKIYNATKPVAGNDPIFGSEELRVNTKIKADEERPTDPATYSPGQTYKFNATVDDPDGVADIDTVRMDWNNSGYEIVSTRSQINSTAYDYEYSISDLAAGSYSYTWWVNDTSGNIVTDSGSYTVDKVPTTLQVAINGTQSNQTFVYSNITNTTGWSDDTQTTGVNLYRNGSSVSNPEIVELGAGVWNYTVNFTHENYTNSTTLSRILTIEKKPSGLSLTSSAGWNIQEGVSTEISCSFASYVEENETLKIGDTVVTSPYSFKPSTGTYSVFCGIENYNYTNPNQTKTLYVNPLISCTSNDTFTFSASISTGTDITTLKLTDLVNQSLIRETLGDIYAENVSDIWINKTGGYYAVINNTGLSEFTFKFGNYYINKTYSSHTRKNVQNLSSYTQINPYIHYNILNELTGEELYPQNSTITSILTCPSGENYIPVDKGDTNFILAGKEYFDKAVLQVKYTADMYYSRQIYPKEIDSQVINFYVVDAYEHALDRIDFEMVDINYYDSKLIIYKTWGGQDVTITEGYFDASHMFSAYLREDTDYYLKTVNPSGDFGRMTIVQPAKKQLGKAEAQLNPQAVLISDNIMMNAYMNSNRTEMTIEYDDNLNQTDNVTITVYFQNGTKFKESTHTSSHVLLTYNTTKWESESFSVTFSLYHQTLNDGEEVKYKMSLMPSTSFGFQFGSSIAQLIALGLLMFIGGITTRRSLIGGSLLFMIGAFLFYGMGWLEVPLVLFGLTIFLFIMGIAIYLKTTGE